MKKDKGSASFSLFPAGVFPTALFFVLVILSGCAALWLGGEIQQGRSQLMYGDPKVALAHFQRAAAQDPDYELDFALLTQGVGTYTGRAYYDAGNLPQAREALEAASRRRDHDYMAKLYLGLTLARVGARAEGLNQIEAGLRGLKDWLDYIDQYNPDGRFWDPGRQLRAQIEKDLDTIAGKEFNWSELIASGEWLGKKFEEEIDSVRRDRWLDEKKDSDNSDTPL